MRTSRWVDAQVRGYAAADGSNLESSVDPADVRVMSKLPTVALSPDHRMVRTTRTMAAGAAGAGAVSVHLKWGEVGSSSPATPVSGCGTTGPPVEASALCHSSRPASGPSPARFAGTLYTGIRLQGEVAEWLKALAC